MMIAMPKNLNRIAFETYGLEEMRRQDAFRHAKEKVERSRRE